MKTTLCKLIIFPLLAAGIGSAQVQGSGTAQSIPRWVNSTTLGDSNLFQAPGPRIGLGTHTPQGKLGVVTIFDHAIHATSLNVAGVGVEARATNTSPDSATTGVRAFAPGPRGRGVDAFGGAVGVVAVSEMGTAMVAQANERGFGLQASSQQGDAIFAFAGPGNGISSFSTHGGAVYGQATDTGSTAGIFVNTAGGNILVGRAGTSFSSHSPVFRVDSTGRGFFDGGTQVGGADFAESMAISGEKQSYAPGDLLVIDTASKRQLALAHEPYSTLVAGIYSTKPGVLASPHGMDNARLPAEVPLAIVGIVPCKVSAENGAIAPGDLLVSSSTPGHAMKGVNKAQMLGAVVGKALEPLPSGKGVIQVLVTLQ